MIHRDRVFSLISLLALSLSCKGGGGIFGIDVPGSGHGSISVRGGTPELEREIRETWRELMVDLGTGVGGLGMLGANPEDERGIVIILVPPLPGTGGREIKPGIRGDSNWVGGVLVIVAAAPPGFSARVVRHELAHCFCHATLGGWCMEGGRHWWITPSGRELWGVVD